MSALERLWDECRGACNQERVWHRGRALGLSAAVCLGRRTVTGLVGTSGSQFRDWSATYRLFSQDRVAVEEVFGVVRSGIEAQLYDGAPLVTAMDDTVVRKSGAKIYGVRYRRDPLSPPFHANLVRGQRFVQISAALPARGVSGAARMIPIDFAHAPTPARPRKGADAHQWTLYEQARRAANVSRVGVARLQELRASMDRRPAQARRTLWTVVDGRFTNATVLKGLPERTVLIGRIRKDTKLYYLPQAERHDGPGRTRKYGQRAPTPEQLRQDPSVPWQTVTVRVGGKRRRFRIKTIAPLRWRAAGAAHDLRLIVIAPLCYRARGKRLYRKPAYLICTDPTVPLKAILQAYIWRWDIEVNIRDEKQLLGVGEAQVRNPRSVQNLPALLVASYALLLLAATQAFPNGAIPGALPPPRWRRNAPRHRLSTADIIAQLRAELWGKALGLDNFSGFTSAHPPNTTPQIFQPDLTSAILYAAS